MIKRYIILTFICCLVLTSSVFAAWKVEKTYMGEETVQVGDIWQPPVEGVQIYYDATNLNNIEPITVNIYNDAIKFTEVGDTTITAYFPEVMETVTIPTGKSYQNPTKYTAIVKTFHVVPSSQYGSSIKVPIPENNYAQEVLELFNKERTAAGLEPLILDEELCRKATIRAQESSINQFAEFMFKDEKDRAPILKDKNYKNITEQTLGTDNELVDIMGTHAQQIADMLIADEVPGFSNKYKTEKLLKKKYRYLGVGFVNSTEKPNEYWWSILLADKKE
ncbi:hypothetical protein INF25_08255 [Megamonas funiformis]|nr:hypothetical protein [Megamonas funiformis]